MHVKGIDTEIIGGEAKGLEDLLEGEVLVISVRDKVHGRFLDLGLNETEEVLLVHAGGVVHVRVNLSNVVKVPVRHTLPRGRRR